MAVLVLSTASGLTGLTSYLLGPGGLLSRIIAQALFVSAMVYAFRLAGLAFRSSAIWILLLGGFAQWFLDPLSSWSNAWVVAVLIEGAAIGLALRSIRALVSWGAVAMVAALWGIGGVVSNWTMHMWFDVVPMGMLGGSLLAALAGGVTLLLVRPPGFTPAFGQVLQTLGTWVVAWFLTLVLGRLSSAYVNGYGYSLIGSISGLLFGALAGGAVFAVLARTVPGIAPVRAPN